MGVAAVYICLGLYVTRRSRQRSSRLEYRRAAGIGSDLARLRAQPASENVTTSRGIVLGIETLREKALTQFLENISPALEMAGRIPRDENASAARNSAFLHETTDMCHNLLEDFVVLVLVFGNAAMVTLCTIQSLCVDVQDCRFPRYDLFA